MKNGMGTRILASTSGGPASVTACRHRPPGVPMGRRRTVTDDSGSLAITAWTCPDCGELVEEIRILSGEGQWQRSSVRYTVASPDIGRLAVGGH
jgi:hypothetical protein